MSLRRRQRERKKSNRFRSAKQQLCTCITLFVHFFAVTARLRRELPNFAFYRQREHTTTNFSRLSLNLNIFLKNSNPGKFAYFGQSERVVMIALQFQKREVTFWVTFSPPSSLWYLKLPNEPGNPCEEVRAPQHVFTWEGWPAMSPVRKLRFNLT